MSQSTLNQNALKVITRQAAKAIGSKTYFTGEPCKHGHVALRRTINGCCTACEAINMKRRYDAGLIKIDKEKRKSVYKKYNKSEKGAAVRRKYYVSGKQTECAIRYRVKDPKRFWAARARVGAEARAKEKGLPYGLDVSYIVSIMPDVCPVFGTTFVFYGNKVVGPESPTLDRIKPELGYVKGNIVVISSKANMIKSAYSVEDIRCVADWLEKIK